MRTLQVPFLLTVVAACLLTAASAPAGAPGFSRSRWIADRREQVRFDGGVLPARQESFAGLELTPSRPPRGVPPGPPNTRISEDVLAPDPTSQAEAETEAETFLAQAPQSDATLLAGYQEDRFADGGARALTAALSTDAGATWHETLLPQLTEATGGPWQRASDPWVAFGPDGRAFYATLGFNETTPDNGVFVSVSPDGGHSWGAPVTAHLAQPGDFDDKEAVVVDGGAASRYRGRIYVGWDTVTSDNHQILRMSSSDDGAVFTPSVDVFAGGINIGCIPLVAGDGTVYAVWLNLNFNAGNSAGASILLARSEDGGATWSAPQQVAVQNSAGVRGLRTGDGLPSAAIDLRSGRLWVVWNDDSLTPQVDQIVASSSSDGGRTWSAPVRVSDGPTDAPAFNPAIAINAEGIVAVAYASLRNDPARRYLVDQYMTVTNSRGVFGRSLRQSTQSFDVRFAAIADGFFLGDYQGLVAGAKTFRPIWVATNAASRIHPASKQPDAYGVTPPRR